MENNYKWQWIIIISLCIFVVFSLILYFYFPNHNSLTIGFGTAFLTILGAYIVFLLEQISHKNKKKMLDDNLIRNLVHELDYNLGPVYSLMNQFDKFLSSMENRIKSVKKEEFKEIKEQDFKELINEFLKLIAKYKVGFASHNLSKRFMEEFVKEFETLSTYFQSKFGATISLFAENVFPINFFTFDILNQCTADFSIKFEEVKKNDAELRKQLTKLKHIYNVYYTNFRQIREVQPIENMSKLLFRNAVRCNIMFCHEFIENNYNLIQILDSRYSGVKRYIYHPKAELDRLKRVLEKKEF